MDAYEAGGGPRGGRRTWTEEGSDDGAQRRVGGRSGASRPLPEGRGELRAIPAGSVVLRLAWDRRASQRARRGEGGAATILVAAGLVIVLVVGYAAAVIAGYVAQAHSVRGAADLAALSGAQTRQSGGDACAAARRIAARNDVEVTSCKVAGDWIDFVVSVRVQRRVTIGWVGLPGGIEAVAHAGRLTGTAP